MTTPDRPRLHCLTHLDTVLIGSSLLEGSDAVVRTGTAVARAAGAKVYLLHVAAAEPVALAAEAGWQGSGFVAREMELRRGRLREQAERLGIGAAELAGLGVAFGLPHREIVAAARAAGAELIVVGASEPGGALTKMLGSTADRVVRKASCPVLVVRGELPVPPRRVLLPVDLSELSADAFRCGLHLLDKLADGRPAEIEALYALDFLTRLEHLHSGAPHIATPREVEQQAALDLEHLVHEIRAEAPAPVRAVVRPGDARVEILAELERKPADLVILGTHGRSGFDRLLLGSVAATVLREAPCSVLTIPPAASLDEAIGEAVLEQTNPARHVEEPVGV
jgi:nucleotide-binding universal stress UspA family protein